MLLFLLIILSTSASLSFKRPDSAEPSQFSDVMQTPDGHWT